MIPYKMMLASVGLSLLAVTGGAQAAAAEHVVTMSSMSYGKIPSDLNVGDTVVWTNDDSVPHSVTARDKSFDLRVAPGRSAKMTLAKAGTFPFYCIYHSTMRGTLKVGG